MRSFIRKSMMAMTLGTGVVLLPAAMARQDEKKAEKKDEAKKDEAKKDEMKKEEKTEVAKPSSTIPTKMPDFSKDYAASGEISGVVVMGDAESVVIQLKYRVPSGGKNTKEETKNLTFRYAEGALARTKVPPMRPDAKGKMVKVPGQELEPRKKPQGAPGLHLDRTELKPGDVVTLSLLRPKSIPEKSVTIEDKLIKIAVVTNETTPPKLSREQSEAMANKKKFDAEKAKEKKDEEKKK